MHCSKKRKLPVRNFCFPLFCFFVTHFSGSAFKQKFCVYLSNNEKSIRCFISFYPLHIFKRYYGCFYTNVDFLIGDIMTFTRFPWIYPKFGLFYPYSMVTLDVIKDYPVECYLDISYFWHCEKLTFYLTSLNIESGVLLPYDSSFSLAPQEAG